MDKNKPTTGSPESEIIPTPNEPTGGLNTIETGNVTGESGNASTGESNRESNRKSRNPSDGIDTTTRKPRTRKPAAKTAKGVDLTPAGAEQIASYVCGIHKILDLAMGNKGIIAIEEAEAAELTKAALEVAAQYKMKPNPRVVAWCNLIGCVAIVYTPKVLILRAMAAQAKRDAMTQQPEIPTVATEPQPGMRFN
jgi:hypothetical protein